MKSQAEMAKDHTMYGGDGQWFFSGLAHESDLWDALEAQMNWPWTRRWENLRAGFTEVMMPEPDPSRWLNVPQTEEEASLAIAQQPKVPPDTFWTR